MRRFFSRAFVSAALILVGTVGSVRAQTLVVCDDVSDPLTLDPQKQFSQKNHTLLQQIFEGLVRFDQDGKIAPALAVSWEQVDPLTLRFHLRQGVKFQDGEPFDAEAVRYTIARYLDPKTGYPAFGFVASIASATVVDPLTVDLHTYFPDGLLLNRLAGFILIDPPRYIQEHGEQGFAEKPVGTGPFRFARWERGHRIVLEANRDYWQKGRPGVETLVFDFLPIDQQVQGLLKGKVNIVTELPGTQTETVARSAKTKVIKRETFYTVAATIEISSGPLKDARVRRALNEAIDRSDFIRYDLLGNGRPVAALAMPGEEGYDESLAPYPYDLADARKLLAESGVKLPLKLKALVYVQGERAAKILKRQFDKIGVDLEIAGVMTDADAISSIQRGGVDLAIGGIPDPMAHSYFLESLLLYSKSPYSLSKDPAFDRALEGMVATLDPAQREKKARELNKMIYDQALGLFTYQRIKTYGVTRNVLFAPSVTGMPYFADVEMTSSGKTASGSQSAQ